jgi:hypothetical protein
MLAREAIRFTQAAYHMAGDRGRLDELAAVFTEDGILELSSGTHAGRDAIKAGLSGVVRPSLTSSTPGGPSFRRHHLTTSHVEFDGPGSANGWSYFFVVSPIGLDHAGRYVDRYAAVGERWLIARRRVCVEWAAADSAANVLASDKGGTS